jgi:DNA invertase Pin-like site-specific DNA recombinase
MLQRSKTMAKVAYVRVSTEDQNIDRQQIDGMDKVFVDKISGGSVAGREALAEMIDWVREDDEVFVHSIDRLARNLADLQKIITTLNDKKVSIRFQSEGLTFSHKREDAMAMLQLQMIGAFAQWERSIIRQRIKEGVAKAKARGVYKGRAKSVDDQKIIDLRQKGVSVTEIAKKLTVSRMSVYRALKDNNAKEG